MVVDAASGGVAAQLRHRSPDRGGLGRGVARSTSLEQIGARLFGNGDSPVVPPRLDFRVRDGKAERMTALALFWPMPHLAERSDPLAAARGARAAVGAAAAEARVAAALRDDLRGLPTSTMPASISASTGRGRCRRSRGLVYLLRSMDPAETRRRATRPRPGGG
ncbi:hypothetical protein GS415_04665 [Rhodococcus hoagii]|nr:hypothetical protein [Prescottella equi]